MEEQFLLKQKIKVGQIYQYICDYPKGFKWDTTGYRMIIIDDNGEYLAYKNGCLVEGNGKITNKSKFIVLCTEEIKEIIYNFKPTAFWREIFGKLLKNTNIKLIKVK